MKKFYYLLLVLAIGLASCSKDEDVDVRDQYVGTWSETYTTTFYYSGQSFQETDYGTTVITKGNASNEILLTSDGEFVKATVNGTSFTIPEQNYTMEVDGTEIDFDYAGNGTLIDGKLEYSITMKDQVYGMSMNGKAVGTKVE